MYDYLHFLLYCYIVFLYAFFLYFNDDCPSLSSFFSSFPLPLVTTNVVIAQIHIVEAVGLVLLESVVETEVETRLPLHVAAYTQRDGTQVPFTVCHKLPLKVEPEEQSFTALPG